MFDEVLNESERASNKPPYFVDEPGRNFTIDGDNGQSVRWRALDKNLYDEVVRYELDWPQRALDVAFDNETGVLSVPAETQTLPGVYDIEVHYNPFFFQHNRCTHIKLIRCLRSTNLVLQPSLLRAMFVCNGRVCRLRVASVC